MEPKLEIRTKRQEMGMLIFRKILLPIIVEPSEKTSELLQVYAEKMALRSQ